MGANETIVGIATPVGFGGIGIVRISGPAAPKILAQMFTPTAAEKGGTTHTPQHNTINKHTHDITPQQGDMTQRKTLNRETLNIPPRRATLGRVTGTGFTDTAIAIYFPAPHSSTGENVAEIQAHGGYKLLQKITRTAIEHGAVPAANGEFSKRAFLNGKLSLEQAESITDIINAESDAEIQNAGAIMQGALRKKLDQIETGLVSARANIDAYLDYPEDLPEPPKYDKDIKNIIKQIDALLDTASTGTVIKNGISVAIIGKPNAGKSSLFNAILNANRSIVTDIAGTTTDTITEHITHNGVKINFIDTAGIRDGQTVIESAGIERTVAAAATADVVLVVLDATTELNDYDRKCIEIATGRQTTAKTTEGRRTESKQATGNRTENSAPGNSNGHTSNAPAKSNIIVYNKTDIKMPDNGGGGICISAKTGKNITAVLDKIVAAAVTSMPSSATVVITNERHTRELAAAKTALARTASAEPLALDMASTDITEALSHIGAVTGTNVTEATLDEIFSKFCLGK